MGFLLVGRMDKMGYWVIEYWGIGYWRLDIGGFGGKPLSTQYPISNLQYLNHLDQKK
jgi:hypothetical protein